MSTGWKLLLDGFPWFTGVDAYPLAAYSEFLPPVRAGRAPYQYAERDPVLFTEDDPWGWHITEREEEMELRPGMTQVARHVVRELFHLVEGKRAHGIARNKLTNNPAWPDDLASHAPGLKHERHVVLLPLALSLTQDDKGRLRWTLFGNSEQGPAHGFWRSFFTAPDKEAPAETAFAFLRELIGRAYGEPAERLSDLRAAGLRILPLDSAADWPWTDGPLPSWVSSLLWKENEPAGAVRYLLTFRPFAHLPAAVKSAYLEGRLHLLPSPASLLFWGPPPYLHLQEALPFAIQIPLLHVVGRHRAPGGLRVPQSGWIHESHTGGESQHGPVRNTIKRTHRWDRVLRDQDELALLQREAPMLHALFSSLPEHVGLYDKPMARNVQLWSHDFHLLLDGPEATLADLKHAMQTIKAEHVVGYRFLYPAMRVGHHEVYWHRPLVAWQPPGAEHPEVIEHALPGYLTAYAVAHPERKAVLELWPRILQRPAQRAVLQLRDPHHAHPLRDTCNARKLLDAWHLFGDRPLSRSFARHLLTLPHETTLDEWLETVTAKVGSTEDGKALVAALHKAIEPPEAKKSRGGSGTPESLTFGRTAKRTFEEAYWKTIVALAEGTYLNKNNADCVRDHATQQLQTYHDANLEALGNYILAYHRKVVASSKVADAVVGEMPFRWQTDFDFSWMGGWSRNLEGASNERNLVVMIPGRDRSRAVIMADHYDTAYMEDRYYKESGGHGARLAACGADDNHSATAALMLAAPIFLDMSKEGRLACDIWLVHLTGEEFPADCLGARHLSRQLVQGTLQIHADDKVHDVSKVRVQGVYVLDMVAHNTERERDVFQIAPGTGRQSLWLAKQAHLANKAWNDSTVQWNKRSSRRGLGRGRRSPHGAAIPAPAQHPALLGEVRPTTDPRSTLFNTDGQIFSDAGVPVVLFMENYDITRSGYHDTHDTMANIDLDYGAAVTAIAIESVARAATENPDS